MNYCLDYNLSGCRFAQPDPAHGKAGLPGKLQSKSHMHIGILIFSKPKNDKFAGAQAIVEAAEAQGHTAVKLYEPLFTLHSQTPSLLPLCKGESRATLLYENQPLPHFDIIIARPNFIEEPSLHRVVIEALCEKGIKVINSGEGMFTTKNKLQQHIILSEAEIPMPHFAIARDPELALAAAKQIGFPCVIKVAFGTVGIGIFFANDPETFSPIVDYLSVHDRNPIIIQEFIKEVNRTDVRAFVVGNKIVASMERTARGGDIRSNIGCGGVGTPTALTDMERDVVLRATRAMKLDLAGVDLLRSARGPLIIEVNANPGFEGLQEATGVDVAAEIVRYATTSP